MQNESQFEKGFMVLGKRITFFQKASSHGRGLLNSVKILLSYRKAYRNYLSVLKHIIKRRYPIEAILRDGQEIMVTGFELSYNLARLHNNKKVVYDTSNGVVKISNPASTPMPKTLKLKGGLHNGEIANIFLDDVYRNFPVEGKIVLDVGANIADSCLYFMLRGAQRVIGIEPLVKNYEMAAENVKLNNYSNRISIMLAGCGARPGSIKADRENGIGRQLRSDSMPGGEIPLLTLEQILQQNYFGSEDTVLKMDCEGCEYDVILSSSEDVLSRFSNILIEYHYGYNDIKEKLERSNFDISLVNISGHPGGPTAVPDPERIGKWYYMGYIHANRKSA
jgi:FkbM family methyltransferase